MASSVLERVCEASENNPGDVMIILAWIWRLQVFHGKPALQIEIMGVVRFSIFGV